MSVNTESLKRIFALEAERERGLKERNELWAKVAQLKFQVEAMNVENTQVVQEVEKKTNEIDRLKAELAILSCPICGSDVDGHNWKLRCERLARALREAIDMIESEYCSHDGPHSKDSRTCYAQPFYQALADYKASISSPSTSGVRDEGGKL